jgi:hypothetical protein
LGETLCPSSCCNCSRAKLRSDHAYGGDWVLFAHERQVAAELQEELAQIGENGLAELSLGVLIFEAEEFEDVVVLERQQVAALRLGGETFLGIALHRHVSKEKPRVDLTAQFAHGPAFAGRHGHVEVAFAWPVCSRANVRVMGP